MSRQRRDEAFSALVDTHDINYGLRWCPDCCAMRKKFGFRRGPHGQCCAVCFRGYLPD